MTVRALFVTHEGFGTTIFRSQVIEHCESMIDLGYVFDLLTYEVFAGNWANSSSNFNDYNNTQGLSFKLRRAVNMYWPGSTIVNLFLLAFAFIVRKSQNRSTDLIHARSDYSAFLCIMLWPLHRRPVVWDCRGDAVDELNLAICQFNPILRALLYLALVPRQKFMRTVCSLCCRSAVCVSTALDDIVKTYSQKISTEVIPCPVPLDRFYFSESKRQAKRRDLEIEDDKVVFIYSGSMTGYQGISEFYYFYREIINNNNNKLIILTSDIPKAEEIFSEFQNSGLIIHSCPYEKVVDYYCAADVALMTRVPRQLNWVASPTKFGEYCLTGLRVVHNHAIQQVIDVSSRLENSLEMTSDLVSNQSYCQRVKVSENAKLIYSRAHLNLQYVNLYKKILNN